MSEVIAFTKVRGPHGWLGSMSPHPIGFHVGPFPIVYRTAEHLFQCLRFAPDDPARAEIVKQPSPMRAKMVAKRAIARATTLPRSEGDVANMRLVLLCKLHEHPDLRAALLETRDAVLVEDVSARASESGLFWGMARDGDGWRGANVLGNLWVEIRGDVRAGRYSF